MCSVMDAGMKRYCIAFPKKRGHPGGWATLALKLRSLGIVSPAEETPGITCPTVSSGKIGREMGLVR